ncbi:MAG: hypothetical protein J6W62_00640 [Spirochaetia bacterium]|nr:hypothetical protein [Spirochaetia bacterium]
MKKFLCNSCIFINIAFFAFSDGNFYKKEIISAIFSKIKGKSNKVNCTVPLEEFYFMHILHIGVERCV